MALDPNAPTLIFLHIPKAGGTTLQTIIERNYAPGEVHRYQGPQDFKKYSDRQKRGFKVVSGHFYYGLHKDIPQPTTYFTMLRDPIERVISNYFYVLRTPEHHLHAKVKAENMTLRQYVESKINPQLDNGQMRLLCGEANIPFGGCTAEMLAKAKQHLRNSFAVIGLVERFDDTLNLLARRFAWQKTDYAKANVTANRPQQSQIDAETLAAVENCNVYDRELYHFAEAALTEQLKA